MLADRGIALEPDFYVEHIDQDRRTLVSYDEREVGYDLLVTVPLNMGAQFVGRSGLGDELNYAPVDPHTLRPRAHQNIFAIGDAADLPTSKAGSVAHFAAEVFTRNFVNLARGRPVDASFDEHANCFIESGGGKALLSDFDYEREPVPGRYPFARLGPLSLLSETRVNHLGKLAFQWLYWHVLPPGARCPCRAACRRGTPRAPPRIGRQLPAEEDNMPVTTIDNRPVHVTDEGFLSRPEEWDEGLARTLAGHLGITLTEEHWKAVRFLRNDYAERHETPTLRRVSTAGGVPIKQLFVPFPQKPAKKMAYIAGLPKPQGCV